MLLSALEGVIFQPWRDSCYVRVHRKRALRKGSFMAPCDCDKVKLRQKEVREEPVVFSSCCSSEEARLRS